MRDNKILNKLISNWFYNLKNNKVNDEILYIGQCILHELLFTKIIKYVNSILPINRNPFDYSPGQYWMIENNNVIKTNEPRNAYKYTSEKFKLTIYNNYSHSDDIENIYNEINNQENQNILFICPNSHTIRTSNYSYLKISVNENDPESFFKLFVKDRHLKVNINNRDRPLYYNENFPFIKIIKDKEFTFIKEELRHTLYSKYLNNVIANSLANFDFLDKDCLSDYVEKLICNTGYERLNFSIILEADLNLLSKDEILTSRLAIILYRVFQDNIDANKTHVGRFISDKLNIKSKTINFKKFTSDTVHLTKYYKVFRGYRLIIKRK